MAGNYDLSMPRVLTMTPADENLTGYASNVSGAAWTLTANTSGDSLAHQVSIRNDSANNKSSINITVVGTDQNGAALSETITGPTGSATVETTGYFKTVTSVTPASTWGADTADIGWVDEVATQTINLNWGAEDVAAINVDVGGTISYTLQQTFDPLDGTIVWQTLPGASAQTADAVFNTTGGATAARLIVNSYSSGATIRMNVNQTFVTNAPGAGSGGPTTDVNVTEFGGTAVTLGQKTMAASIPVVLASDQMSATAYSSASRLPVTEPDASPVSGTLTSAATLFTADMAGYESISVQVTSAGSSCTITYETSDDNSNWITITGRANNPATGALQATSAAVGILAFPKVGRYFRARVSTYGSGTVTVVGNLHKNPQPLTNRVTADGPQSTGATYSTTGFPMYLRAATALPTAVTTGQGVAPTATTTGATITKPYSIPEADWQYAAASGGIVDTADNVLVAAGAAGIRNYLTRIDLINTDATVGTEVVVKDGSTVIWRTFVPASTAAVTQPMPVSFTFPTPLKGSAATALNVACITTSSQTYVNAGGYQAP